MKATWAGVWSLAALIALSACGGQPDINFPDEDAGEAGQPATTGGSSMGGAASTGGAGQSTGGTQSGGSEQGGSDAGGVTSTGGAATGGSSGASSGGAFPTGGISSGGGAFPMGGTTTGGTGSSCPQIRACTSEAACNSALSGNCGTCSIGSYACGTKTGFYTSNGEEFACEGSDCTAAAQAVSAACARCAGMGGSGGSAGSSGASGGGAGGSAAQRCPSIDECTGPSTCRPVTTICTRCNVDEYTCTGGTLGTYKVFRTTDGQRSLCVTDSCTMQYDAAYARCCE